MVDDATTTSRPPRGRPQARLSHLDGAADRRALRTPRPRRQRHRRDTANVYCLVAHGPRASSSSHPHVPRQPRAALELTRAASSREPAHEASRPKPSSQPPPKPISTSPRHQGAATTSAHRSALAADGLIPRATTRDQKTLDDHLGNQVRAGASCSARRIALVLDLGVSDTPAWVVAQANTLAVQHGCTLFRCSVVASGSPTWCGCAGRTSTVPAAVYESLTSRPRSGGTWFARTARAPSSFEPSISTMGSWKTSGSDENVYEGRRDPVEYRQLPSGPPPRPTPSRLRFWRSQLRALSEVGADDAKENFGHDFVAVWTRS